MLSRKVYHAEMLLARQDNSQDIFNDNNNQASTVSYKLVPEHPLADTEEYLYTLTFKPDLCGGISYRIRVFPFHELLTDPHEMGMMRWV